MNKSDPCYAMIAKYYGDNVAHRSQVPLIRHIDDGLVVLDTLKISNKAKQAYCLHPMLQSNADLTQNWSKIESVPGDVVALVMEYRAVANSYLSDKVDMTNQFNNPIILSPIPEVNDMLRANKIQNRKDFERYHKDKHERSDELFKYFFQWFNRLNIGEDFYMIMVGKMTSFNNL